MTAPAIPTLPPTTRDLSDEEFAMLDEGLLMTPEPLQPVDAVMLDGFLCGVLVQPVLLAPEVWMPYVFDFDGQPMPDDVDPAWLAEIKGLVLRRHAALNRAIVEDGWFNPLVLEFDDEAEATDPAAPLAEGEVDPMAGVAEVSQPLMPWVAGFQHAALCFPDLADLPEDAVMSSLARLYRHLPAETDQEREVVAILDREYPLSTLDDAIEELVTTVVELSDLTREARYKVDTVKRETPKVGRNDPCPCGSGKKFKQCHAK